MGRTVALTTLQKRERRKRETGRRIVNALLAKQAADRLDISDFCEKTGLSRTAWQSWRKQDLEGASLWKLLDVADRAGVEIKITVDPKIPFEGE